MNPKTKKSAGPLKGEKFSLATLRSEGIIEIGCPTETSVLFILTEIGLRLLHARSLPDRTLDDYAVELAVNWIEGQGIPSAVVARDLGVSEDTLRRALVSAGYDRVSPRLHEHLAHARAVRKFGNRKGRLIRVLPAKVTTTR